MKVVIPLAGFGTRLRPHTWSRPKPLVSVAGKPVLGHVIDDLLPLAPDEMIFITGWLGDQIEDYVSQAYPALRARYTEQKELKGQAHAISLVKDHVRGEMVIVFVDTLFQADLGQLRDLDGDGAIFVKEVEDPRRFGVVVLDDTGIITSLVEKPSSMENRLAVIGLYYVRRAEDLFEAIDDLMARNIQTKGEFYLADAFNLMIERGARLRAPVVEGWEDCGTTETLLETNRSRLGRQPSSPDQPGVAVIPPVLIAPDATVERAVIGPHVSIGAGAVVRDAIVRDAVVDDGATVEQALVEHSVVGRGARLRGRFQRVNLGETSASLDDGAW
ncbi:MAG: NTP transferase domain-containing protein [Chloroflexi bacterium]|nr:NTP transferase domain-containing protein [Chloroflexota bacterium]